MQENNHFQQRHHPYGPAVNGGGGGGGGLPTLLNKRPNNKPAQPPLFVPPGKVAIRLLCHVSGVGGLIGKSGSIIRQLQQETSAKIRVEDLPSSAGSNSEVHRVIAIVGPVSIGKRVTLHGGSAIEESEESDETVEVSAAQEAAVRVFERVIAVAAESDDVVVEVEGLVSCRLLIDKGQVGAVIGTGGKTIEMIKKETLCRIKVLNKEKLPACALPNDVMVELEGDIIAVKKALIAVCSCLQECAQVNRPRMNGGRGFEQQEALVDSHMDLPIHQSSPPRTMPSYPSGSQSAFFKGDRVATAESRTSLRQVVFNILCPNDRVGGVIGKGGSIVKNLQNESGASINVGPSVADSGERVITISAMENPESRQSPAQSGVILVFNRFVAAAVEKDPDSCSKELPMTARLVVQANEVGCLLGKGGAIIAEMRKVTGAGLRIIAGDQVPKCATGNVEVVQITGTFVNVQNALYNVTSRLRDNLLPLEMPNASSSRSSSFNLPESNTYHGGRAPPPFGFRPSGGVSRDLDHHSALVDNMDQLKLGQDRDRPPSPKSWVPQSTPGANQRSGVDIGRDLNSVKGAVGIGSGSRSAVVTSTTVEITVPDSVINSIYGENGSNLSRLRQISGAKVIVHEPHPGSTDRTVVISGSPDQTQAAQSLLQAFILTGSS